MKNNSPFVLVFPELSKKNNLISKIKLMEVCLLPLLQMLSFDVALTSYVCFHEKNISVANSGVGTLQFYCHSDFT